MIRWTIKSGHGYLRMAYIPEEDVWITTRAKVLKLHNHRFRRTDKVISSMTLQQVVDALTVGKPIQYKYDSPNQAELDTEKYYG